MFLGEGVQLIMADTTIHVYKGFNKETLKEIIEKIEKKGIAPLVNTSIDEKLNVLRYYDKIYEKKLKKGIYQDGEYWMTYDEYAFIQANIDVEDDIELVFYKNNIYPNCYPASFDISNELTKEYINHKNSLQVKGEKISDKIILLEKIYSDIIWVDEKCYCTYYNSERIRNTKDYYKVDIHDDINNDVSIADFEFYIDDDIEKFLHHYHEIIVRKPKVILYKIIPNPLKADRFQKAIQVYCAKNGIKLIRSLAPVNYTPTLKDDLVDIAKNDIGIESFKKFRKLKFYKDEGQTKEIENISQSIIISTIIEQAEKFYDENNWRLARDIFITAPTGAGKSVIFQIPAIYLAKKYKKLTIIIEPVIALMNDQVEKLRKNGYNRAEALNSDVASANEKEKIITKIKNGDVDLLYLSPETLLSYALETLIGDRDVGLLVVDEAHIVTTWGVGFRHDYWYLGDYIDKLRSRRYYDKKDRKVYHFPICTFTATAVNGGEDDTVDSTINSLNMQNAIKYIGYVKRDDISFDIVYHDKKIIPSSGRNKWATVEDIRNNKNDKFAEQIRKWLKEKKKTVVYFPFHKHVDDAFCGIGDFGNCPANNPQIGTYAGGGNRDNGISPNEARVKKNQSFFEFRIGKKNIMYATKAFGMGIDIDDINTVYHYAVTGTICDYVQEIGRAARKEGMKGIAKTDFYDGDLKYMDQLFGMSQIRSYQLKQVLTNIYNIYRSTRNNGVKSRNFLISPESFAYIFGGKNDVYDVSRYINKIKTCLLMLEKDFDERFGYKVLIARPNSIFTKAFIVINDEHKEAVMNSRYGNFLNIEHKGKNVRQLNNVKILNTGDIYSFDLKSVWEKYYRTMSFPQFKWYFYNLQHPECKILADIKEHIGTREKVTIRINKNSDDNIRIKDLKNIILDDIKKVNEIILQRIGIRKYFTPDELAEYLKEDMMYTKEQAIIIANSFFDIAELVPRAIGMKDGTYCLKQRGFVNLLQQTINCSDIMKELETVDKDEYVTYLPPYNGSNGKTFIPLKLLALFDHITYETVGGSEPEIFIRLNNPNLIRDIVKGKRKYYNSYITKAKEKHERAVSTLLYFFKKLKNDKERWDFIEDYFLNINTPIQIAEEGNIEKVISMEKRIDDQLSKKFEGWKDFFDDDCDDYYDKLLAISKLDSKPTYAKTVIKTSLDGDYFDYTMASWPKKNVLLCYPEVSNKLVKKCKEFGWSVFRINTVDINEFSSKLE